MIALFTSKYNFNCAWLCFCETKGINFVQFVKGDHSSDIRILFCSLSLHLFDPKYSKSSNIVKYFLLF